MGNLFLGVLILYLALVVHPNSPSECATYIRAEFSNESATSNTPPNYDILKWYDGDKIQNIWTTQQWTLCQAALLLPFILKEALLVDMANTRSLLWVFVKAVRKWI